MGISRKTLSKIVNGRGHVTSEIAIMNNEQNGDLLTAPEVSFTASKTQYFESLISDALSRNDIPVILTTEPYPKVEFLQYLVAHKGFLLHGSNQPEIAIFEPRQQTDYEGRKITAVFAAEDGIAPIFYAILDRTTYKGSMRNAFRRAQDAMGQVRTYYCFSIDADSLVRSPWREGTIYVFARHQSTQVASEEGAPLLEWTCYRPIQPLLRVRVAPSDFPFLENVQGHNDRLGILLYKFFSSYEQLKELSDGYAFAYRWTNVLAADVVALIELVGTDIPPMQIELVCEPNSGPVWLHIRGSTEIKATVQSALDQINR
jgi:hypothetical protein